MNPIQEKILEATQVIEEQVDAAIQKLDNMDMDELDIIQRKRAAALRKQMKQKEDWIANGHGEYSVLTSEKEFFDIGKKSDRVVLHCYRSSTMRCAIVDKHLDLLAKKHIETKFCKLDVEKAPFLCERLKIRVIPTIVLCKGAQTIDYIVGFDELGGVDDFSTEMMEWRIAKAGVINYDGDLTSPPESVTDSDAKPKQRSFITHVKKNIRGVTEDSDSDE